PWVVRNLLENFLKYYSYFDQVKIPVAREQSASARVGEQKARGRSAAASPTQRQGVTTIESTQGDAGSSGGGSGNDGYELAQGGISFAHDMGAANAFAPFGHSSYE